MPWFRYYTDALDNPKIQDLPAALFKFWVTCLCISKISEGILPELREISFRARVSEKQCASWVRDLQSRSLIDKLESGLLVMHDWNQHQYVSDDVTKRVQKHRAKRSGNVSETPPEQKQSRAEYRAEQNHPEIGSNGNGAHPPDAAVEFPAVLAEIRKHDPGVNEVFVRRLMQDVVQKSLSNPKFPPAMLTHITDENVARCVAESYRSGPKQHGTGLLLSRVPDIVFSWSLED